MWIKYAIRFITLITDCKESIQKIMTTFPSLFSVICNKYAEKIRLFNQHYKVCMLHAVNRVDWVTAWTLSTEYN